MIKLFIYKNPPNISIYLEGGDQDRFLFERKITRAAVKNISKL
jgi:hypothetical protein